jgi:hypothetical protein
MKLRSFVLAFSASICALPTAGAATEHYAASGNVRGSSAAELVAFAGPEASALGGDALGVAGCSLHSGGTARDTMTLGALGAVVLLVVRRLLQASS